MAHTCEDLCIWKGTDGEQVTSVEGIMRYTRRAVVVRAEWVSGCTIQKVSRLGYPEGQSGQHLNIMRGLKFHLGLNPGTVLVFVLLKEKNSDRT